MTSQARGPRGFGSSDLAFGVQEITAPRPLKDLLIQGNKMSGLLDTGADISCIAGKDWPSSWPTRLTSAGLVGPFSLWGRDILSQMGMLLYSPDEKVTNQILQMRYNPDKGLGKDQQGIAPPLEGVPNTNREGLGYLNLS